MARNGCRKVVIINGHGGNTAMLQHFIQAQLDSPRDYVVYTLSASSLGPSVPDAAKPSGPGVDGHAGESEISRVMASRPDLVHVDRASTESGVDQSRLRLPDGVDLRIAWYSRFPNHYQGNAAGATAARGSAIMQAAATRIAEALRAIKADDIGPRLQKEFFEESMRPRVNRP